MRQHAADAGEHVREGRHVCDVVALEQHPRVIGGERVQPVLRSDAGVLDLDQPGHRLLLEPLARVARRDSRLLGQLMAHQRAMLLERPVEAKLRA